jgi:AGZA family xanthine/uracil permease-like MFS transporter
MSDFFELGARNTTVGREVRGAVATFLTMAYILFANPSILAAAGVPFEAAVAATAAAAGVCCLLMGLGANFPLALAPGMGLNAVIAFQVAGAAGSWQTAMGLVVLDGLVVLLLVIAGLREAVMHAIPHDLRRAIAAGIGLFIAFIGAVNAKLVIVPIGTVLTLTKNPAATLPPVTHGVLGSVEPAIALFGLIVIAFLLYRRIAGAIILGIAAATVVAIAIGIARLPAGAWVGMPRFDTMFQADVAGALSLRLLPLLLSLVMVDFFDTIGTVTAIAEAAEIGGTPASAAPGAQAAAAGSVHAGPVHADPVARGIPRLRGILAIDAVSASIGGLFGASSVTSYIESASGIAEGARTGLHTVCVGILFLLAMFAVPVVAIVPAAATAPALIIVGFLMCGQIVKIDFAKLETAIPAFLILLLIPLTYSISHGIGIGFIAYVAIRLLAGHARDVHPLMYATALAFVAFFVWG